MEGKVNRNRLLGQVADTGFEMAVKRRRKSVRTLRVRGEVYDDFEDFILFQGQKSNVIIAWKVCEHWKHLSGTLAQEI